MLKPEAAAALADLRERTGRTYSAIIWGLLLADGRQAEGTALAARLRRYRPGG